MNTSAFFPHITLIGVGLIGGSFMLDLKRLGLVQTVTGIDTNADNLNYALECGIIDHAYPNICAESIGNADLVLIATPVSVLPDVCRDIKPFLKETACVSDVGSTKQSALNAFRTHLSERLPQCFAAHPIAGSDQSGAKSARCGLFQNSRLIITLHGHEASDGLRRLKSLWQAVGSQIFTMSAEEHDNIFAAVSHLPHLTAFAYRPRFVRPSARQRLPPLCRHRLSRLYPHCFQPPCRLDRHLHGQPPCPAQTDRRLERTIIQIGTTPFRRQQNRALPLF